MAVAGREILVLRPRDSEALLDEEAFEHEEFLPYWAELWPSAVALARAVYPRSLAGARVLELGCGLGVPSIAAALRGARVVASDWSPEATRFAALNAQRNGVRIETIVCSWSAPAPLLAGAPWDVVLASDVMYERRNVDLLLELLPRLVERGEVVIADPGRPPAAQFEERAARGWHVRSARDARTPRTVIYRLRKRLRDAGVTTSARDSGASGT